MSKKLKLSPWHDGSVKPAHVGVYQREWKDGELVATKWSGKHWSFSFSFNDDGILRAMKCNDATYDSAQSFKWRGVLK